MFMMFFSGKEMEKYMTLLKYHIFFIYLHICHLNWVRPSLLKEINRFFSHGEFENCSAKNAENMKENVEKTSNSTAPQY